VKTELETTVVFGDVHGIYVDRKAWNILLQIIDDIKPQRVIINGDFMDCYSISTFDKDPNRNFNIQDEFEQANKLLDELQSVFKGEIVFIFGNHCDRLRRLLWGETSELACLPELCIEDKLHLNERRIKFIKPIGKSAYYKLGKMKIGHFNVALQDSCASAKKLVTRYACTVLQSHTHRLGMYYKTFGEETDTVVGVECGCLCQLRPEYVCDPDWQAGFVVISKIKACNRYHIQTVPIINHETLFIGKLYKA
jgi:predicted phosphodiesterase